MGKLDDVLDIGGAKPYEEIKADIKALFNELIGKDENAEAYHISAVGEKRNELRAELRKKIEEL